MFTSSLPRVHVLGANIYGYTTAILLLVQGYKVTLLANEFPGEAGYRTDDTTWSWQADAGSQHYDTASFKMLWHLAKRKAAESGMMVGSSFKYYEEPTEDQANPAWNQLVPGFKMIDKHELPKDVQLGYHYTTVMINTKRYLTWLQTQFLAMGGRQRKASQDAAPLVVNCDGSSMLHQNQQQQQQWTVRANQVRRSIHVNTKHGEELYLNPRLDGTVVFGINRSTQHYQPRDLLERISAYCPELTWGKGLDGLTVEELDLTGSIGLDDPRVENQYIATSLGTKRAVTHNYGHRGHNSSWGAAQCAVRLVNEAHGHLKKDSQSVSELLSHL